MPVHAASPDPVGRFGAGPESSQGLGADLIWCRAKAALVVSTLPARNMEVDKPPLGGGKSSGKMRPLSTSVIVSFIYSNIYIYI